MGFLELVVIAVVGLLVVGPERLPDTIKVGVVWFSRVKRMIANTRAEVEQQIGMDELRREIHNEQVMETLNALKKEGEELEYTRRSAEDLVADVNQRLEDEKQEELFLGDQQGVHGEQHSITPETLSPNDDTPSAATSKSQS